MNKIPIPREEQETDINWFATEKTAVVDTCDPKYIRKLDKMCEKFPDDYRLDSVDSVYGSKIYTVPVKCIRFCSPPSQARIEQGKRNANRLAAARKKQANSEVFSKDEE